jgi:predicted pyridoxine 5'-phosphate oxidase superfamily flavin-nucleotide-binding protein
MKIPEKCRTILQSAEGKALATYSAESGPHVVPVSSILVEDENIILVNYFFNQTLKNISTNPVISLSAWTGLEGYQVKGTAKHEISGPRFDAVVTWIQETIPGRIVKGILVITPEKIFNVSAGSEAGKEVVVI